MLASSGQNDALLCICFFFNMEDYFASVYGRTGKRNLRLVDLVANSATAGCWKSSTGEGGRVSLPPAFAQGFWDITEGACDVSPACLLSDDNCGPKSNSFAHHCLGRAVSSAHTAALAARGVAPGWSSQYPPHRLCLLFSPTVLTSVTFFRSTSK